MAEAVDIELGQELVVVVVCVWPSEYDDDHDSGQVVVVDPPRPYVAAIDAQNVLAQGEADVVVQQPNVDQSIHPRNI